MSVLKCKLCGGTIEFEQGKTIGKCKSCGLEQKIPGSVKTDERKAAVKETVEETVADNSEDTDVDSLLKSAFTSLKDSEWSKADDLCEQVLKQDPENARAYLGKLMAELQVHKQEKLADCKKPFDNSDNYKKAVSLGEAELVSALQGYIENINERNESYQFIGYYNRAVSAMKAADSEESYKAAAQLFKAIPGPQNFDALAAQCLEKAEECRKDSIYLSATSLMGKNNISNYETAMESLSSISGWKDADELIKICKNKIEELKNQDSTDQIKSERETADSHSEKNKTTGKRIRNIIIVASAVLVCIGGFILLRSILPEIKNDSKYNSAIELFNAGKYDEAIEAFTELDDYKDSKEQITRCEEAIMDEKYDSAVKLINTGEIINAYESLMALDGYKDSKEQADKLYSQYKNVKLKTAVVGDIVYYGSYEQDNNVSNDKEDIEWIVLAKDNDSLFLISRYALDSQRYNSSSGSVTWETSYLRKRINTLNLMKRENAHRQIMQ